jgi:glycosyltransferase involved in cell wall biosynthesis
LKIAFLVELFHPHVAGCENRFLEIGKRLSQRDHEVHVFTLQHDSTLLREETIQGIAVHRCAYSGNYLSTNGLRSISGVFKYSFAASLRLVRKDFDICYSNQWPGIHSIFAKPVAHPLVQEWCEVWNNSLKAEMLQEILKWVGDYHVAVSEFTKRRLIGFMGIAPEKVSIVPNGVDVSKFHSNENRKMWGHIVYVGRLVPHKHIEMLIDAFHKVKQKNGEAELHIIGEGPCLPTLRQKAAKTKDCYVHGFLPEDQMIDLLNSSWLSVLPSEREGSSISVLEGMASGLPFVTADFPNNAVKELAKFECGLVADPNEDSIASAIFQLMNDEEMYGEMSHNALSYAKQRDWNFVADGMEGLMRSVVRSSEE